MTPTNGNQFISYKICRPRSPLPHMLSNPCPYLRHNGELEGHFFVAGLKETKSNMRINRLRSQYTGVTSHINTTHRNGTQLHIFHIFTNTSAVL